MADRIPLIVDTTDGNKIKELPGGDNLDLTSSAIVNASSITTTGTLTAQQVNVNGTNLAAIATTGNYDDLNNTPVLFTGDYNDLTNKPTIPTRTFELFDVLNTTPDNGDILRWNTVNTQWEAQSLSSSVDLSDKTLNELQNVIISGSAENKFLKFYAGAWRTANVTYAEVQNAPTRLSELINDAGFVTEDSDSQTLSYDGETLTLSGGNSIALDSITASVTTNNISSDTGNITIAANNNVYISSSSNGTVEILNLVADLTGSVYADDSTILVDAVAGVIPGSAIGGEVTANLNGSVNTIDGNTIIVDVDSRVVNADLIGDVTGNVTGDVTGDVTGNLTGSVYADDSSLIFNSVNRSITVYSATVSTDVYASNVEANSIKGNLTGSVFADDSTVMIDGMEGKVTGDVDSATVNATTITGTTITGSLRATQGTAPTDALDPGDEGEVRFDDNYIYIKCPGGDWKRVALTAIP